MIRAVVTNSFGLWATFHLIYFPSSLLSWFHLNYCSRPEEVKLSNNSQKKKRLLKSLNHEYKFVSQLFLSCPIISWPLRFIFPYPFGGGLTPRLRTNKIYYLTAYKLVYFTRVKDVNTSSTTGRRFGSSLFLGFLFLHTCEQNIRRL